MEIVFYGDLDGFLHTDLLKRVVPDALSMMKGVATKEQLDCAQAVVANAKEAAFGSEIDYGEAFLARLDATTARATVESCAKAFGGAKTKPAATLPPGAEAAWEVGEREVFAVRGGMFVIAKPEIVADAFAKRGTGAGLGDVSLAVDEYATFTGGARASDERVHGSLAMSAERIRFSGELEKDNADSAERIAREMVEGKRAAVGVVRELKLPKDLADAWNRLVDAFDARASGKKVLFVFNLVEPVDAQAKDLGSVAAIGKLAVQKYIQNAKSAEAKNSIGQISRDIVSDYESERMGPNGQLIPYAKKKLVSFPAVPKTVPKGVKYQSTPADWKPWTPIKFEMDAPQYYQYEVKAAADGQSCVVVARGDLNGDGKTSRFELTIRKKGDRLVIDPMIKETDPEE